MLKSMRQSVGEPAYFHGGMAEEQFQARLDQQMAADLAAGQGATFADSLFETDHPEAAALLAAADKETAAASSASRPTNADAPVGPHDWEQPLTELLAELSDTQASLLDVLDRKRQMLVGDDRAGLAEIQPEEQRLGERLQACLQRRQELLDTAGEQGLPHANLRTLAKALPTPTRDALAGPLREARSRSRVLQHQSLTNWVLVQRRLLQLSQMIEIVATGGRQAPTYPEKGPSAAGGVLVAMQIGLQVTSNNIANANTEGFVREKVNYAPAPVQQRGNLTIGLGVQVDSITQVIDEKLGQQLRDSGADLASANIQNDAYKELERLLGELSSGDLSTALTEFFGSIENTLNATSGDPLSVRNLAILEGEQLAAEIRRIDRGARDIRNRFDEQIGSSADVINQLTQKIRTLNVQITQIEGGSANTSQAGALRTERNNAVDQLAELIAVNVSEQPSGGLSVSVGGEFLVFEGQRRDVTFESGDESGEQTARLQFVDTGKELEIVGGSLQGWQVARDEIIDDFRSTLDRFASTLIHEFNLVHSQGQGLEGFDRITSQNGVDNANAPFAEAGLPFPVSNGEFVISVTNNATDSTVPTRVFVGALDNGEDATLADVAAQLEAIAGISASIDVQGRLTIESDSDAVSFSFSEDSSGLLASIGINTFFTGTGALDIGVNSELDGIENAAKFAASLDGVGGTTRNAVLMAGLTDEPLESLNGASISEKYDQLVNELAQNSTVAGSVAEGLAVFQGTLAAEYQAVTGVNLDEEAVEMLLLQDIFQATARYISTIQEPRAAAVTRIAPISTTRVTTSMTRDRLTNQIQADQRDLLTLQNQLSTGFRIFLPSDDPASAQRAIALQRTIERKEQSATNASGAQIALATADLALSNVSDQLNSLRAEALAVVDTIASEDERNATIETVDRLLDELTRVGNTTFTSTYVFGGTETTSPPYEEASLYVEFSGTEGSPQTYVDIGQLFDAGVSGADVFGGFSEPAGDGADLNPQLTPTTRLSQVNGGLGLSPDGAIEVLFQPTTPTEPAISTTIDLSRASTIEDVARLIEAGAPGDADLTVTVSGSGLRVDVANGGVTINEVGQGATARELGLLSTGVPLSNISGSDLDPVILRTDPLDDLLGAKARGRLDLGGGNNDLVLTAESNGSTLNGLTVEIVAGPPGAATAAYDGGTNTLTLTIEDGVSTAAEIADAINGAAGVPVTASTDYRDQTTLDAQGTGAVSAGYSGTPLSGGADGEVDVASGLLITNGSETYTVDTSSAETVEDLLSLLNTPDYGLDAQINAAGDGIDVRTRRSGADFTIGENGGTTATDLGIRTYTRSTRLADFNRGVGVFEEVDTQGLPEAAAQAQRLAQNEFVVTVVEDGVTQSYTIDPVGLTSVDDLIDQIAADTFDIVLGGPAITADLAAVGNGLVLSRTDVNDPGVAANGAGVTATLAAVNVAGGVVADSITVSGAYAERLGFVPPGEDSVSSTSGALTSEDRHVLEVDSVFTTLIRMREALVAEDSEALGREINRFDDDLERVSFGRAEVGVRLRNLESIQNRLADEQVELRSALSDEIDADLVEVISDYTAKQFSYQASLQTAGSLLNLSLLGLRDGARGPSSARAETLPVLAARGETIMQIQTTRFGSVEVRPADILTFPQGLIGLEPWSEWVALADGRHSGLGWLQSTERADLAFAVVSPRRFVPGYKVRVSARDLGPLEAPADATPQVVVTVSCHGEGALSLNLKAPLLVCLESRRGKQVVAKDDHPVRHWLGSAGSMRRTDAPMLVLSRQRDESIIIGDNVVVTVVDVRGDKVRLGIDAPVEIPVHRREVYEAIQRENRRASEISTEQARQAGGDEKALCLRLPDVSRSVVRRLTVGPAEPCVRRVETRTEARAKPSERHTSRKSHRDGDRESVSHDATAADPHTANANLSQSLTRLSTGLRINTGADDPAGLIASENLRSDITSIRRAIGNTDRANQVIATADSALGQVSSLLNDIRGLVTESANSGALSDEQIAANQLQVDSSLEALNRIAQTTTFQGRRLLDGSLDFLTNSGANPTAISNVQIDQANLGATGSVAVDVTVSTAATQASVAIDNLPDVTPTTTTSLEFDVQTSAAVGSTGSVDFDIVTTDTVQSVTTLTLGGAGADEIAITAVEDGIADGLAGNGFAIVVNDATTVANGAVATFDGTTLTIDADITNGVGSDDVAAAIQAAGGASAIFTAVSDGTDNLLAGDEAAIEAITGGNTSAGADAVSTTETIDIVGVAGVASNINIAFAESALGAAGPTTNVIGNATSGYTLQINSDTAAGVGIGDIRTAIEGIAEVDSATITTAGTSTYRGIEVGGASTFLDAPPATEALINGADAVTATQTIDITTAVGFAGDFTIDLDASTDTSGAVILSGSAATGYTIDIDDDTGTTVEQIRAAIESIAEVGTATLGQNTTGTLTFNAANGDTVPAQLSVVGAGVGTESTGLDADLVFELAGENGSEVLSFEAGTTITQLIDGVNAISDATGVTAAADDAGTGVVFTSSGYGSNAFVDLQIIDEGTGATPAGTFTTAISEGTRSTGTDVTATVNGISATGDGNDLSINTATLDLSATLTAGFVGSSTFTITGGGALFQLGPDVVSNQQARLGINSVNTAALGGTEGLLYQLGTGGDADLASDPTTAAAIVESAIDQVTSLRGRLGAFQRTSLETNRNALNDTLSNLTEAESSIRDADFAEETANLTRSQILVQSGTRVLAIANQNPQNVLALLN
ncbi:unnamed protein product [Cladocopium goreaui]|uniref:Flagellar assembly factor FliW n=1 Tax=Cladocopium goreaui TaxID=2562237 RepID=A0A9P1CUQ0_9DINO|nr:unnamed protein product [Cladocopium goreaui]